jgi:hypothetical protein
VLKEIKVYKVLKVFKELKVLKVTLEQTALKELKV